MARRLCGKPTRSAFWHSPKHLRSKHTRPDNGLHLIITTCETGEMAALTGKLLKDMRFTNVHILKGGTVAWKDAGYHAKEQ